MAATHSNKVWTEAKFVQRVKSLSKEWKAYRISKWSCFKTVHNK